MSVFVDTSALFALLDADDERHAPAVRAYERVERRPLVTHSYVVVEACALVERRLGPEASRTLLDDLLAPVEIAWVDEALHRGATSAFLRGRGSRPSLVDCTSFELMRARGMREAFAFDAHFAHAGFDLVA